MAHVTDLALKQQTAEYPTEREHLLGRQKRVKMRAIREAKRVKMQTGTEARSAVVRFKIRSQQVVEKSEQTMKFWPSPSEIMSEEATAGLLETHGIRR
ncbi:hypothetical protein F5879DRAFT_990896 [Lentinula edodes]|nr:hypothetical protein F5879DRAFT_990896 [Lentinula edodes]